MYVLGTATRADAAEVHQDLKSLSGRYNGIVLLLDPDFAGRQARNLLNAALPGCWHAFIPAPAAVALEAVGFKEIGDIGVEHAAPGVVKKALARRRRSDVGRTEFSREGLRDVGLIAVMHERVRRCFFTVCYRFCR